MPTPLVSLSVLVILLAAAVAACDSGDKERIDGQNDAAATREASVDSTREPRGDDDEATARPAEDGGGAVEISVFDLRVGDCIAQREGAPSGEDGGVEMVRVAPCNHAEVSGAVTELFLVEDPVDPESAFPGEAFLEAMADERCDRGKPFTYLIPLAESWSSGDRTIVCVDDYTAVYVLGGCVDESDRAIACGHEDALRVVTALIDVSDEFDASAEYPGVDYFDEVFADECRSDDDYYLYPTARSWSAGDREVVCTRPME
ncbi:MAG: hypothetical protein WEB52_07470 [Dehalococcoidia bacterium]